METSAIETARKGLADIPLVVDLDGTLFRGDLLVESAFAYLGRAPTRLGELVAEAFRGKAALKAHIAAEAGIEAEHLPYDPEVLALIQEARSASRPVYLASASNEHYVREIAEHLALFDDCFGSNASENLSSDAKAARLVETFGERGFDYIGNDSADLKVWARARRRIAIRPNSNVLRKLLALDPDAVVLQDGASQWRHWIKLLRVHQWSKNALVFVPPITAHHFSYAAIIQSLAAFIAFSLAASGIYLINDLVDLGPDRKHSTKRNRPLAAGTIPVWDAMLIAPALVATALAVAFLVGPSFGAVLVGYLALTTAYTFVLKRKMMIDVVVLAGLYTLRVIGGAAAVDVPVSEWLLAFSMFIFVALALIKRYVELAGRLDGNLADATNRNYRKTDLNVVAALAAASAFNAVTVFTLYISSDAVRQLYAHPQALWLICPILMYWMGRLLILAHRRMVDEDPILFAIKDRVSTIAVAMIGAILFAAA
jgi:4-hydroxybenzoate polyprenyltransferase/phosphoserine phosphatase